MESASFTYKEQANLQPRLRIPRASIIVSTYNGDSYLKAALDSLLCQSFADFELIVVDDGSSDRTASILKSIDDPRLIVVRHDNNLGIAASQNHALGIARGEYIVLQDHDDISKPFRLQSQISFLDRHPEFALVGSDCLVIDEQGSVKRIWIVPRRNISLKWALLFLNPFLHTSAVIRRCAVESVDGYSIDSNVQFVEDYDLVSRIAERFDVANIPRPLVYWREHQTQASSRNRLAQMENAANVSRRNIERLLDGNRPEFRALKSLKELLFASPDQAVTLSRDDVREAVKTAVLLENAFCKTHNFPAADIRWHLRRVRWLWGKHLIALACRRNGKRDVSCRSELMSCGIRFLAYSVLA